MNRIHALNRTCAILAVVMPVGLSACNQNNSARRGGSARSNDDSDMGNSNQGGTQNENANNNTGGSQTNDEDAAEGGVDVSFEETGAANSAVGKDANGNEYAFRESDDKLSEVSVRLIDGRRVTSSLDAEGRPVKFRAADNTNADFVYLDGGTRVRFTDAEGRVTKADGIQAMSDVSAMSKAQSQAVHPAKRTETPRLQGAGDAANPTDSADRLRLDLQAFSAISTSAFDDPQNPAGGSVLEVAARLIAALGSESTSLSTVMIDDLGDINVDEVPQAVQALAGRTFELVEAQGACTPERGVASELTFGEHGELIFETDRKFIFSLGLGGPDIPMTIDWQTRAGSELPFGQEVVFDVAIVPVFTATQLDEQGRIVVERRFEANVIFPFVDLVPDIVPTSVIFNAAYTNGVLDGDDLAFDVLLTDLIGESDGFPLVHARYRDAEADTSADLDFPCQVHPPEDELPFACPTGASVFSQETLAVTDPAMEDNAVFWSVTQGYGYVIDPVSPNTTLIPLLSGMIEVSLVVTDTDSGTSELFTCQFDVETNILCAIFGC